MIPPTISITVKVKLQQSDNLLGFSMRLLAVALVSAGKSLWGMPGLPSSPKTRLRFQQRSKLTAIVTLVLVNMVGLTLKDHPPHFMLTPCTNVPLFK